MKRKIPSRFEGWHTFVTCVAMFLALQILKFSVTFLLRVPDGPVGSQAVAWLLTALSLAGLAYLVRELVRQLRLLRR